MAEPTKKKPKLLLLYRDGTLRVLGKTEVVVQPAAHEALREPLEALTRRWIKQAGELLGFEPSGGLNQSRLRTRVKALTKLIESLQFGGTGLLGNDDTEDGEDPPGDDHG